MAWGGSGGKREESELTFYEFLRHRSLPTLKFGTHTDCFQGFHKLFPTMGGWKCNGGKEDPDTATETARQGVWPQAPGEREGGNGSLVRAGRGYGDSVSWRR